MRFITLCFNGVFETFAMVCFNNDQNAFLIKMRDKGFPRLGLILCFALFFEAPHEVRGDLSYSIPEEMKRGSVVGNVAKDLGVDLRTLASRQARVDFEGTRKRYCDIAMNTGDLILSERIDREILCGKKSACVLKAGLVLENPLELHRLSLHIQDVNDNSPHFNEKMIEMEIRESAEKGYSFSIEEAHDADIGSNGVQRYILQTNDNFILAADGSKVELTLENKLDREKQKEINLLLTALDGGSPQKSGTVVIHVTVLDANDNAPVFPRAVYKATVPENAPLKTIVVSVSATDADEGVNGDVTYQFGHMTEDVANLFSIDSRTGEITVMGTIDYEERHSFEIRVKAKDGLGLNSHAEVLIDVIDGNDNAPEIYMKSLSNAIPENVSPGTEVGIMNVQDRDSDKNGQVRCSIQQNVPFKLVPSIGSLVSKVIEVDEDSGKNAWLSYHIVKATDPGLFSIDLHSGEIRTQRDISESDSMKQNLIVAVKDNGQPSLSATCSMYLLISDNLAEVPELKDISYDENNSKLTSYLIVALVSVSTFFLTFIIIILGVRFCRRRKPRLLFDGAVAIPGAYLPPNYADVDGTGTLRSTYNYDAYLTTGSRTSDFKFVSSYNDNTLPADQTLRKSPTKFIDPFEGLETPEEVGN
ncbi:protocadherin beta-5-like [Poecilia formosa]|uniref:protocadherin beta-5-like n=1 Tax=Poecilia formosa TaxID=48698 RepID=UPI0007BA8375|nr:PREDICTED: protocadherin beta-5-like [Poecilia formosa]